VGSVVLYLQIAANAVLFACGLVYSHPAMGPVGRVVSGIGYAFAPFLLAFLLATLLTKHYPRPTTRNAFLTNLEMAWSLTLLAAVLIFVASLAL
jgi:hypothetical protein